MIDIHSHILPNLDDGSSDWGETIEMCRLAENDGIDTIIASPHVFDGIYSPSADEILESTDTLRQLLKAKSIKLNVIHGADLHIRPDLRLVLKEEPRFTIGGHGRYFLLELPHSLIPPHMGEFIYGMLLEGFIPIITHPERNKEVQRHKDVVKGWVEKGALIQVTAMSFLGGFGDGAKETAFYFLNNNFVHVLASDAHSSTKRKPVLSEAVGVISKIVGCDKAKKLVKSNPSRIIEGKDLD